MKFHGHAAQCAEHVDMHVVANSIFLNRIGFCLGLLAIRQAHVHLQAYNIYMCVKCVCTCIGVSVCIVDCMSELREKCEISCCHDHASSLQ